MRQSTCFILQRPNGTFYHEGNHPNFLKLFGLPDCTHCRVLVTESTTPETATQWAWWDEGLQTFKFIWPSKMQVEMCFAYGVKVKEEKGEGKLCPVEIEILEIVKKARNEI